MKRRSVGASPLGRPRTGAVEGNRASRTRLFQERAVGPRLSRISVAVNRQVPARDRGPGRPACRKDAGRQYVAPRRTRGLRWDVLLLPDAGVVLDGRRPAAVAATAAMLIVLSSSTTSSAGQAPRPPVAMTTKRARVFLRLNVRKRSFGCPVARHELHLAPTLHCVGSRESACRRHLDSKSACSRVLPARRSGDPGHRGLTRKRREGVDWAGQLFVARRTPDGRGRSFCRWHRARALTARFIARRRFDLCRQPRRSIQAPARAPKKRMLACTHGHCRRDGADSQTAR